jgi:hypothetical protein
MVPAHNPSILRHFTLKDQAKRAARVPAAEYASPLSFDRDVLIVMPG